MGSISIFDWALTFMYWDMFTGDLPSKNLETIRINTEMIETYKKEHGKDITADIIDRLRREAVLVFSPRMDDGKTYRYTRLNTSWVCDDYAEDVTTRI